MADVFENNGYKIINPDDDLVVNNNFYFLNCEDGYYMVFSEYKDKTTITYEKFMELFAPKYEVTMIAEKPKDEMKTFKIKEYSTGDFMDLGKDAGIIKAKNKDHAWELYKETHRLKDSEKGFYSFTETAKKPKEFQNLVESLNEELTDHTEHSLEMAVYKENPQYYAKGIDTFARMEANCTIEECLAFAKGSIDSYNWSTKEQSKENFEKIISYASWAVKLLEKENN